MTALALACALARDPVVARTLRVPSTRIRVAATRAFRPGESVCTAQRADGEAVEIGIAAGSRAALAERAAAAHRLGMWSDDGAPVAGLGVPAVNSYLGGITALAGGRLVRVAVFAGGRDRDQIVEAEGVLLADSERSKAVLREVLDRVR